MILELVSEAEEVVDIDHHLPSSLSTTTTSMAPLSVAGFIEFHVLDTDPDIDLTYCIIEKTWIPRLFFYIKCDDGALEADVYVTD